MTRAAVSRGIDNANGSMAELKRLTRAGMGGCQGRYCAPLLASMLAEKTGHASDELSGFAPRAPVRPIAISALSRIA